MSQVTYAGSSIHTNVIYSYCQNIFQGIGGLHVGMASKYVRVIRINKKVYTISLIVIIKLKFTPPIVRCIFSAFEKKSSPPISRAGTNYFVYKRHDCMQPRNIPRGNAIVKHACDKGKV